MTSISRRNLLRVSAAALAAPYIIRPFATPAFAKAPMLGVDRPNHYRFKLGGFEITTINDGAFYLKGPAPIFGEDQFPEDVAELAVENFLPTERMEIGFSPVVINTGNELVLFDTGNGAARMPGAGNLVKALKLAGYEADQIDVVVLTHFHGDHIGGLIDGGAPVFKNARYVTGEGEYDFWIDPSQSDGRTGKLANTNVKPLADKMKFLKDGSTVASGITALDTPGHTPGHMSFHLESEGQRMFLGGDFCNHYVASLQRPDWHVRFDMDKELAATTRRKTLDMLAAEKIPFTAYHMPFPAVGYVEKAGDAFRYVAASYQLNL